MTEEFNKNIPGSIKKALGFCSEVADEQGLQIFLIGGVVRDIIINKKNFDVDITVQGNAIDFAKSLEVKYPQICILKETHEDFKTAKVLCKIDSEEIALDIASTRKESYPYPASLPKIEEVGCELYEDVIRRDFSINSMALSINKVNFCELQDYLGGYEDLKQGKIKVLNPKSFIDDPTRIIRALKFSVRFGYELESETKRLMQECLDSGQFDNIAGERVKLELKQAFNTNLPECMERFVSEDIYRLVDVSLPLPEDIAELSRNCRKVVNYWYDRDSSTPQQLFSDGGIGIPPYTSFSQNIWLVYLGALVAEVSLEKISEIAQKLYLSCMEEDILQGARGLCEKRYLLGGSVYPANFAGRNARTTDTNSLKTHPTRFEVYEFFEKVPFEAIMAFLAKNEDFNDKVDLYLNELKDITISSNGNTLIKMGLTPGVEFGKILREVLKAKINEEVSSSDEEINLIKRLTTGQLED